MVVDAGQNCFRDTAAPRTEIDGLLFASTTAPYAMDDSIAEAHGLLCVLYLRKREYDKAIAEGERAMALDPGGTYAVSMYTTCLNYSGRQEEAIPLHQKAIRLNPLASDTMYLNLGVALRTARQFEEAI
jgi:tetratricopeptide (TPR) repeat protein